MCRNYTILSTFGAFAVQHPRKSISSTNTGEKVMGAILSIASWVGTPLGGVVAVALWLLYFFMGGGSSQICLKRSRVIFSTPHGSIHQRLMGAAPVAPFCRFHSTSCQSINNTNRRKT